MDYYDPLSQGPRPSTPNTTLDQFYQEIRRAWRAASPDRNDRVTVVQEILINSPVRLRIVFDVRAESPEEALGKILLAASRETIRIHG